MKRATVITLLAVGSSTALLSGCPSASAPTSPSVPSIPMPPSTISLPTGLPGSNSGAGGGVERSAGTENTPSGAEGAPTNDPDVASMPAGADPGFGESPGNDFALPSLIDEEPTFSSASAVSNSGGASGEGAEEGSDMVVEPVPPTVVDVSNTQPSRTQTMSAPDWENSDTMTTEERIAVLDKQLEASTGVFDAIILEEQRQQRSSRREEAATAPQTDTETTVAGRNPYESPAQSGYGSTGGGLGGPVGASPDNPAVYEAPEDIPTGNDDDIVARQLREAAIREPDADIREALWNEYRKYKGLEIPE